MLVREPELTSHETVGVFRLGEIGKHPLGIVVQRIDIIDGKLAMYARRVLSHGEIYASAQLLAIGPHLHITAEGIDV